MCSGKASRCCCRRCCSAAGRGTCAGGILLRQGQKEGTHSICHVALHLKPDNINIRNWHVCVSHRLLTSQTTYTTKSKCIGPKMERSRERPTVTASTQLLATLQPTFSTLCDKSSLKPTLCQVLAVMTLVKVYSLFKT